MDKLNITLLNAREFPPKNDKTSYLAICLTSSVFGTLTTMGWIIREWLEKDPNEIIYYIAISDLNKILGCEEPNYYGKN